MGIQPRKVLREAEGRVLRWLLVERDQIRQTMYSYVGMTLFDEDSEWCVAAKICTDPDSPPVAFAVVFSPGQEDMYVWDDDPKPTADDVREWFKTTVRDMVARHGRPARDFRQSPGIEDELGEDGRRIDPARDMQEVADDLHMNSGAAREQDGIAHRAASNASGKVRP